MTPQMQQRVAELLAQAPEVTEAQATAAARVLAQSAAATRLAFPATRITSAAAEPVEQQAA